MHLAVCSVRTHWSGGELSELSGFLAVIGDGVASLEGRGEKGDERK